LISLPERVVRSAAALAGGLIRELGDVTVPAAVRRTKTYQTMVEIALRFMIEQVGQVEGVYPSEGELASNFLLRRTAGHGIELAGLLAFRASPVWIMAALADISGAGRQIVQEISEALKEEGLLDRESKFENIDQLLDGLEQTTGQAVDLFNAPPLDVAGLRKEWATFRQSIAKIPPRNLPSAELIRRHWDELKLEAAAQTGPFSSFPMIAVAAISRAGDAAAAARATNRAVWRTGHFCRKRPTITATRRDSRAGLRRVLGGGAGRTEGTGGTVFAKALVVNGSAGAIALGAESVAAEAHGPSRSCQSSRSAINAGRSRFSSTTTNSKPLDESVARSGRNNRDHARGCGSGATPRHAVRDVQLRGALVLAEVRSRRRCRSVRVRPGSGTRIVWYAKA
jgi:hypothetical protein